MLIFLVVGRLDFVKKILILIERRDIKNGGFLSNWHEITLINLKNVIKVRRLSFFNSSE